MRPPLVIVVAGLPQMYGEGFEKKIRDRRQLHILTISWVPLDLQSGYSSSYARELYDRLVKQLRKSGSKAGYSRAEILANANLLLLYVEKENSSELFTKFDMEALILPLAIPSNQFSADPGTPNQQRRIVNILVRKAEKTIRHGQGLLAIISEEVKNRDNRTCLLLPRRNFGRDTEQIIDFILNSTSSEDEFKKGLRNISDSLSRVKEGGKTYFKDHRGLVFKSPGKSGPRHGMAPAWGDSPHKDSCVIRGRIRFGSPYDPKFHYDCEIRPRTRRRFVNCHGERFTPPRRRTHLNIAPNDNVR